MDAAEQDGRRARNDLLRIDAEELDQRDRRDQEVWRQQEAVNAARRTVEELTIRLEPTPASSARSPVMSPRSRRRSGTVVAPGKPILSIETAGEGLELVLYIPPDQGKKVAPGMEVHIEPATVKKEEFGTLVGRVLSISEFPVSAEGMMAILQNQQLVTRFSAQGAPYAARVALIRDISTTERLCLVGRTGSAGDAVRGTTASAEVTVRTQAPITLVLPLLRERTGIGG